MTAHAIPTLDPRRASAATAVRGMAFRMAKNLGKIYFDEERGRYIIDFRPWGRVTSIPVGDRRRKITDLELAKEVRGWIRGDVMKGATVEAAIAPYLPRSKTTLAVKAAEWLEMVRERVAAGDRSPSYLRELERYARADGHFGPLLGVSIFELRAGVIEDWARGLARAGLSPKTRRNVIGALSALLHWLVAREELGRVPHLPSVRVARVARRIVRPEVQDEILAEIPEPKRGVFFALVEHAIRPGEVRALDVRNYSWRDSEFVIDSAMKGLGRAAHAGKTKTLDVHRVPALDETRAWLEEYVSLEDRARGDRPLFVNPDTGLRFTYWALRGIWRAAAARAGYPDVPLYSGTKHSTMTAIRRAGADMRDLQNVGRHSDPRSTEAYVLDANDAVAVTLRKRKAGSVVTTLSPGEVTHGESPNGRRTRGKLATPAGFEPASRSAENDERKR